MSRMWLQYTANKLPIHQNPQQHGRNPTKLISYSKPKESYKEPLNLTNF